MSHDDDRPDVDRPDVDLFDDDDLLGLLDAALDERDEIPPHLSQYASALFELGGIDAELAQLTYDSLVSVATALRDGDGHGSSRVLVYSGAVLSIEIDVDGRRVLGQIVPAFGAEVVVQVPGNFTQVTVGEAGAFESTVPGGPFRVLVAQAGERVVTPWIDLDGPAEPDVQPAP